MIKSPLVVAAVVIASMSSGVPRSPIAAPGDVASLNFKYAGGSLPGRVIERAAAELTLRETSPASAQATILHNGEKLTSHIGLRGDGTLNTDAKSSSDLFRFYNAIPFVLHTSTENLQARTARWSASIPIRVSPTEWMNIPVQVISTSMAGRTRLAVTGHQLNIVTAQGFTVGEDASLNGQVEFIQGRFTRAHFDVKETVHAYKPIPIWFEWTLST